MQPTLATTPAPPKWLDRTMRGIIFGGGALIFGMLVWGHLGLGAYLFPPAPSATQQLAHAGNATVTLHATSGQMLARGPNTVTFTVQDAAGQPVSGATLHVALVMTTMTMYASALTATPQSAGQYTTHPIFGMAGIWKMNITISAPGQADQHTSFEVSVHW